MTSPLSAAVTAGACPLYGTIRTSIFAVLLNSSAASCVGLPPVAQAISPGRTLASWISSFAERTGSDGCEMSR